jgi:DNA ligase-associated metallophosphoesterase
MTPALVAGRTLVLDASGALLWQERRLLVVADLHLEKASAFARRGTLLPPYDTDATLTRLEAALRAHRPRAVVSLGDAFHDRAGPAGLGAAQGAGVRELTGATDWIWVQGNHDPEPPRGLGGRAVAELEVDGLVFRHIPGNGAEAEVAAHLHPKARVAGARLKLARPCFAGDGRRLLLPAFGSFTGGLNALDPAIRSLFPDGFSAWLLGRARVFRVPHERLVAEPCARRTVEGDPDGEG